MKRPVVLAFIGILIGVLSMSCSKETTREIIGSTEYDTTEIVEYRVDTIVEYRVDTIVEYRVDTIIRYHTIYTTSNMAMTIPTYHCGGPNTDQYFKTTISDAPPGTHWNVRMRLQNCYGHTIIDTNFNSLNHPYLFRRHGSNITFELLYNLPDNMYNTWSKTQIDVNRIY